jgi:hypothetical protein
VKVPSPINPSSVRRKAINRRAKAVVGIGLTVATIMIPGSPALPIIAKLIQIILGVD